MNFYGHFDWSFFFSTISIFFFSFFFKIFFLQLFFFFLETQDTYD
jgi:hypothetical protein